MACKSSLEITRAARDAALAKAGEPFVTSLVMGVLAGAYITFGGSTMLFVVQDLAQYVGTGLAKFIGGAVFSLALFLVVTAGGELFTGNCLMAIGPLSGRATTGRVLRNLVIVYCANFLGAVAVTCILHYSGAMPTPAAAGALKTAVAKVSLPTGQLFLRGILCNWLVAIAVWVAYSADSTGGKLASCVMPVAAFVALGYEHSVANMFFITYGLLLKSDPVVLEAAGIPAGQLANLGMAGYAGNMIPVTAGNIVGGAFCVAALYFVAHGKELINQGESK